MTNSSIPQIQLFEGDCLEIMKQIPADSVDLTVTSPPYDNLREYNGYSFNFEGIAKELYRVTKNGGVIVWVVADATVNGSETGTSFRQALYFKEIGFKLHDTMIFQKASPPIIPVVRRYQPNFEYMFVLVKGSLTTFNPIRIPKIYQDTRTEKYCHRTAKGGHVKGKANPTKTDKIKENVWWYAVGGGNMTKDKVNHPAMFPEKLAQDHILSWSNPGDMVLDPFLGGGTTGKMAVLNGRNFIGIEISHEYLEIAKKRIQPKGLKIDAGF